MGCGRVGVSVSLELQSQGHQVTIIDRDATAFRSLPAQFSGRTVKGVGFDLDTLHDAGVESADAFIAVSSGDNSNIISARVAREKFKVKHVIARIYDPKRAEIYARLGIPTIASVAWSTNQIIALLKPDSPTFLWSDNQENICISTLLVPNNLIGLSIAEIEKLLPVKVVSVQRAAESSIPEPNFLLQDSDNFAFAHKQSDLDKIMSAIKELKTKK